MKILQHQSYKIKFESLFIGDRIYSLLRNHSAILLQTAPCSNAQSCCYLCASNGQHMWVDEEGKGRHWCCFGKEGNIYWERESTISEDFFEEIVSKE